MGKDLTFDELTHLIGATVISCDFDGNAVEEYVVEEYDSEHGRISVSKRLDNRVTSIWPEELYMWHFRFPGTLIATDEMKRCPLKFRFCSSEWHGLMKEPVSALFSVKSITE